LLAKSLDCGLDFSGERLNLSIPPSVLGGNPLFC